MLLKSRHLQQRDNYEVQPGTDGCFSAIMNLSASTAQHTLLMVSGELGSGTAASSFQMTNSWLAAGIYRMSEAHASLSASCSLCKLIHTTVVQLRNPLKSLAVDPVTLTASQKWLWTQVGSDSAVHPNQLNKAKSSSQATVHGLRVRTPSPLVSGMLGLTVMILLLFCATSWCACPKRQALWEQATAECKTTQGSGSSYFDGLIWLNLCGVIDLAFMLSVSLYWVYQNSVLLTSKMF